MTTPDEAFVAGVIEKLTEAQRAFIVKCGDPKRPFRGMWRTYLSADEERELKELELVRWDSAPLGTLAPICRLVERGKSVRHQLLRMESGS